MIHRKLAGGSPARRRARISSAACTATAAVLLLAVVSPAPAATINWGDFSGPGGSVTFEDVTEDNDEPTTLFAAEGTGPSALGDRLILDPQSFQSQSNGGADLIDSTLSTLITADDGFSINGVTIDEFGDYSLGGLRSGEAFAEVGAAFFWRVTEIDGVAVSLPLQTTNLVVSTGSGANGGRYDRPGDDGTAVVWQGVADIDIDAYLSSINLAGEATAVSLRFNNTLQTAADDVSNAFIKKKALEIFVDTSGEPIIPEPAALSLLLIGLAGSMHRRKR